MVAQAFKEMFDHGKSGYKFCSLQSAPPMIGERSVEQALYTLNQNISASQVRLCWPRVSRYKSRGQAFLPVP